MQKNIPFHMISLNLITDLPVSDGYNSILMVVDQGCSKTAIFLPCNKMIDAIGMAHLYATKIFPHYGVAQHVISD